MMNKSKLVLGLATASLAIAVATLAPQAQAHQKAKKHTHKHHHAMSTTTYSSSSTERMAEAANNKVEALEAQVQAMQYELQALRSEARRPVTTADSMKVQELDQWMASMKSEPSRKSGSKDNMVFFRGGYGHADSMRGGTIPASGIVDVTGGHLVNGNGIVVNDVAPGVYSGARADQDAWYFGAGFDFSLNDNFFGLMNGTEVFAELMFDYKQFAENMNNSPLSGTTNNAFAGAPNNNATGSNGRATVNQLTLAASPKVKLFKGSAFRPWLIPIGFELSVISPPSDAITVLNPGLQFGLGADYKIWQNLYVGADARYHYAADTIDGVNTNGVTAGGYLGIGF